MDCFEEKMIGLKALGLGRVAQTIMLIFLLSTILSLTVGSSFEVLFNISSFLQGFELKKPLLMDSSAKSIYTSIIPARLARDIEEVLGIPAKAVTTTLGYVDNLLTPIWDETMLEGHPPGMLNISSCILGGRLAERLKKNVGDTLIVVGILRREIHVLRVIDVEHFKDPRDDYLFVSKELAKRLRGAGDADASIIIFNKSEEVITASKYLSHTYELRILYDIPVEAKLRILASDGSRVLEKPIMNKGVEVFKIPLGYYEVVISTPYADIPIASIKLYDSAIVDVKIKDYVTLRILDCPVQPELKDVKGILLKPSSYGNGTWVYIVPPGLYTLSISERKLEIPLLSDLDLRLNLEDSGSSRILESYKVRFEITYIDGKPVDEVYLTIVSADGDLITSIIKTPGIYEANLNRGDYIFIARKGSYIREMKVSVQGDRTVHITLPLRSDERVLYSSMPKVKLLASGYDPLSSITLIVLSAELTLLASVTVVSFLAYRVIFGYFFESSSTEIEKMRELRLPRKLYLKIIYLPMLTLVSTILFASILTAIVLALQISWPLPFSTKPTGSLLWPYSIIIILALPPYTLTFLDTLHKKGCF
jgi:hypothetical protein